MKVNTANVIVGYEKETMNRLFTQGATYGNLIKELSASADDFLVFNNEANPNFISFEHNYGLVNGDIEMKLSFIDPNGDFEKRFFNTNFPKEFAGFMRSGDMDGSPNPMKEKSSIETEKSLELMKSQEFYNDFLESYRDNYGDKKLFVAYGTGNNLDLWSGPHMVTVTGANITMKGARKIELRLFGQNNLQLDLNNRRGAFNERINIDFAGLTARWTGASEPIELENLIPRYAVPGQDLGTYEAVDGFGATYHPLRYLGYNEGEELVNQIKEKNEKLTEAFPEMEDVYKDFDFHHIVVDALRNYVQNATNNPNVIVLLPNINMICRKAILESADTTARMMNAATASADWAQAVPVSIPATARQEATDPGGMLLNTLHTAFDPVITNLARKRAFINNCLSKFGLSFTYNGIREGYETNNENPKAFPQARADAFVDVEKGSSYLKRVVNFYKTRKFYGIIKSSTNRGVPNHMEKINTVIQEINKRSKGAYQIELGVMTETDTRVLDFWSDPLDPANCTKFPLFGGYTPFDANKEAIIVGDQALINEYLYSYHNWLEKVREENFQSIPDSKIKERPDYAEFSLLPVQEQRDIIILEGKKRAAQVIPLHPLDRQVLLSKAYKERMVELVHTVPSNKGSFGDLSYLPDEFYYEDKTLAKKYVRHIMENRIPVFRYNTSNPNILDLKFDYQGIYFTLLKTGYKKAVSRFASTVATGSLPIGTGTLPITTPDAAFDYLLNKGRALGRGDITKKIVVHDLAKRLDPGLVEDIGAPDGEEAAILLSTILMEAVQKIKNSGVVEIDQFDAGGSFDVFTDFANQMYQKAYALSIKTLPTFHLSNNSIVGKAPCIVFAQDTDIRQTRLVDRTRMNKFISGHYTIMGYKHVISSKDCFSEFMLTKNDPDFNRPRRQVNNVE